MNCFESFDSLCRKIISPTRHHLDQEEMIIRKFKGRPVPYEKFYVSNRRNQNLSVIYFPKNILVQSTIVYLHGNGGNKLEVLQLIKHSESYNFNFCAFDFGGCGESEGEFVTYGEKQVQDISCVIDFIRERFKLNKIFLWGRSMGASLGLLYSSINFNEVEAMVLDSPFKCLKKVLFNVASNNQKQIPNFLIHIAIYLVEKKIQDIVQKDVFECDYSSAFSILNQKNIPIMFAYSTKDTVVTAEDVLQLYQTYKGKKKVSQFNCTHPEDRPKQFIIQSLNYLSKIVEEKISMTSSKVKHKQLINLNSPMKPKKKPGLMISTKEQ